MLSPITRSPRPRRRPFRPLPEPLEARECPSGGLLDPSFHGGAPVTTGVMDIAFATAIQPDGKMVVVGRHGTGAFGLTPVLAVARFNPDGSPDPAFGSGGVAYSSLTDVRASGMALQPDGKILVCGSVTVKTKGVSSEAYLVSRYNANGTPDTTFATKGTFTWDYGKGNDGASGMALLPDGSILVAGGANGNLAGGSSASVFKLSASGSLVTSYGTGGLFLANPGNAGSAAGSIALAPNGDAILVGGTKLGTAGGLADAGLIVAVTPAGRLDPGFNGAGYVATLGPGYSSLVFNDLAIQGTRIVVCGGLTADPPPGGTGGLLARFSLSGTLDATFGAAGYFTTGGVSSFRSLALEADGSIVAGGNQAYVGNDGSTYSEMAFAHLTADGALDTGFGALGTGIVYVQAGPQSAVYDLAITSDGRIFAVGYGYTATRVAALVRLTAP
ncbi:hypothetical protein OJF2_77130 [Aquisphaera giovannonii]|uniref:Delta-60 repeat domain protein n=1 Tax=Aquisphaera giovannonii TaxID=406548 RepID=A0A5B9WGG3_9BACT|nr:hypothetical protein [Aquisphaera giovannonii]QEH39101.1 hypothetical protein OJF2_77130 [Aquisphaera giovannonii]